MVPAHREPADVCCIKIFCLCNEKILISIVLALLYHMCVSSKPEHSPESPSRDTNAMTVPPTHLTFFTPFKNTRLTRKTDRADIHTIFLVQGINLSQPENKKRDGKSWFRSFAIVAQLMVQKFNSTSIQQVSQPTDVSWHPTKQRLSLWLNLAHQNHQCLTLQNTGVCWWFVTMCTALNDGN